MLRPGHERALANSCSDPGDEGRVELHAHAQAGARGQAPCGELNEKLRGSSSSIV